MVADVSFHHVGITVSNLERAVEWYRTAFGLEPGLVLEVSGPGAEVVPEAEAGLAPWAPLSCPLCPLLLSALCWPFRSTCKRTPSMTARA